jgi:hypothetical protein
MYKDNSFENYSKNEPNCFKDHTDMFTEADGEYRLNYLSLPLNGNFDPSLAPPEKFFGVDL